MNDPSTAATTLAIDELARATAVPVDTLRAWQDAGLLSNRGDVLAFEDIERVRVLQFVQQRGVPPEVVAKASEAQGGLLGDFVDTALGPRRAGPVVPLAAAAEATGLDPAQLRRLWTAAGMGDQHHADQDDLAALRGLRTALEAGLPEDVLVQLVRVFADALGRVADAEATLFHHYVHERLRAQGLVGPELFDATRAVRLPLMRLIEPTLLYFHRKAFWRARCEDLLLHLAEDAPPPTEIPGEIDATILFVDLSGFTPLTEAMGDAGVRHLKGIGGLELFSVRRAGDRSDRIIDPVCLMELDPASAAARLTWRGTDLRFCSDDCLRRFVASPERYTPGPPPPGR